MFYTYIIQSTINNKFYIGSTDDLRRRFRDHNRAKIKSTKAFCPWKLVYYEAHLSRTLARKAETFYKGGQGRRQIKKKLGIAQKVTERWLSG